MSLINLQRSPPDLRLFLDPLRTVLRQLLRDGGERPTMVLRGMRANLERRLDGVDPQTVMQLVIRLARINLGFDTIPGWRRRQPSLPHEQALRARFERLEGELPCAGLFLFAGAMMGADKQLPIRLFGLMPNMMRARFKRGEARSTALRALMPDLVEHVYGTAITMVYQTECILRGATISYDMSLGSRIRKVAEWTGTSLSGFADPKAHLIRNAAAHGRWYYQPATREVLLMNESGWQEKMTLPEIYAFANRKVDAFSAAWNAVGAASFNQGIGPAIALAKPTEGLGDALAKYGPRAEFAMNALIERGWRPPTSEADGSCSPS